MDSHPFWVDEFSTAHQANLLLTNGLSVFNNHQIHFEIDKFAPTFLVAIFFKLFGQSEGIARLPFAILGAFVPVSIFFLTKQLFNKHTALVAYLLSTTSYFFITWSRQARGYVLLQLLVLLGTYVYLRLIKNPKNKSYFVSLLLIIFVGIFTHPLFYIFLAAVCLHGIFSLMRNRYYVTIIVSVLAVVSFAIFPKVSSLLNSGGLGLRNNLWYYHSFLWREYGFIVYLGLLGLLLAFIKQRKNISFIFLYIFLHLIFINFIFSPVVTRYTLPIFSFLFIGFAYVITYLTDHALHDLKIKIPTTYNLSHATILLPLLFTLALIINGYKFDIKPNNFYSVNHDFREIALVDYHQVYNIIKETGSIEERQTAIIDTWGDRLNWYMGMNYQPAYFFRWLNSKDLMKGTPFGYNDAGEKIILKRESMRFIGEVSDLKQAMQTYPRGFIWIDDDTLPADVVSYVKQNFKQELYTDHYSLDDNPYSIWPATLYSWGIK